MTRANAVVAHFAGVGSKLCLHDKSAIVGTRTFVQFIRFEINPKGIARYRPTRDVQRGSQWKLESRYMSLASAAWHVLQRLRIL